MEKGNEQHLALRSGVTPRVPGLIPQGSFFRGPIFQRAHFSQRLFPQGPVSTRLEFSRFFSPANTERYFMNIFKGVFQTVLSRPIFARRIFALAAIGALALGATIQTNGQLPGGTNVVNGALLEYWTGLNKASAIESLLHSTNYPLNPDSKTVAGSFQAPENFGVCYGARMRAFLVPAETGDYTFWITADDTGELWFSNDDNPAHRRRIAQAHYISSKWDLYPEQKSATIHLEAGKQYYIEALLKQGTVRDHLAVAWTPPSGVGPVVIPGQFLLPYNGGESGEGLTREVWTNLTGAAVAGLATGDALDHGSDIQGQTTQFELPAGPGNNRIQRVHGSIHAPVSGAYTFWIAGADSAVLLIGTNDTPAQRRIIAQVTTPTAPRDWQASPGQRSDPITLEAGKSYYIEAVMAEGSGAANLSVAWQLPDGTIEGPIPASRLTPYDSDGDGMPDWFERQQGFDPYNPDDGAQDADFDGVSNAAEFRNGTNPHFDDVQKVWRGILLEYWRDLDDSVEIGSMTRSTRFPISPSERILASDFEGFTDYADQYGSRMRGSVVPPVTGDYLFWIAADDRAELWLSADNNPAHRQRIASAPAFTASREWTKYAEQQSIPIHLEAGKQYYIEAIHKEALAEDNLAVAWQIPGSNSLAVISGRYLIPYNDGVGGEGIVREVWSGIPGSNVSDLTGSAAFGGPAGFSEEILEFETPTNSGQNFGQRVRGYVYPPTNGLYTFWIAADASAALYLGTDDTPTGRHLIAQVSNPTAPRAWYVSGEQQSVAVYLEGGKAYYIEALHKNGTGAGNLAVAWQLPNGVMEAPIPATRLSPYDMDGDGMPDWYERRNGLDPHNPDDALQDPDYDGVSNLAEYLLGTDPHSSDSRGDGLPDSLLAFFGFDPRTNNAGLISESARANGADAHVVLGHWQTDGKDIYALDRRGTVEFTLSTSNSDIFLLKLDGTQNQPGSSQTSFDLVLSVDGESLGHHVLNAGWGVTGAVTYFTPFLNPGAHTVRVFWDGAASLTSLRIKDVTFESIADPNGSQRMGMKSWVKNMLDTQSGLDLNPGTNSYVSPFCLEGRDPYLSMMRISDLANAGNSIKVMPNIGARWYANVPLSSGRDANVNLSYQNGGKSETRAIHWQALNVLESATLLVRQGDSILLSAPPGFPGSIDVTVSAVGGAVITTFPVTADAPVPYRLTQPGNIAFSAQTSATGAGTQSGTIGVQVVGYSFQETPMCMVGRLRVWNVTNVPPEVLMEADSRLSMVTVATNSTRQLRLLADENEPRTVIARLARGGPILDFVQAQDVRLFATPDTYNVALQSYPDGSRLVETMDILSPVLSNAVVQINVIVGGVTLDDGTTYRELAAPGDFDVLGEAKLRFHLPPGTQTANCHTIRLRQGKLIIGTY
jgi:hypothetical protein